MKDIATVLRKSGAIAVDELDGLLDLFQDSDELVSNIIAQGFLTEEDIYREVALYSGYEYVDPTGLDIPQEVLSAIPAAFCRREHVLPMGVNGDYLYLGLSDPEDLNAIDDVNAMVNYTVVPKVVAPSVLASTINRFLRSDDELNAIAGQLQVESPEDEVEAGEDLTDADDDAPVVRFVNLLISQAIQDRASDIHVEPGSKDLRVRFRIDGVLHLMQKADRAIQAGVISRIKILAEIDIAEKRKPQDGRMSVSHNGKSVDIRVAALPTVYGEKIIMRILDHSANNRTIEDMDMSEGNLKIFKNALAQPHGMILVTGPTGSGKSTTLYTSLTEVSDISVNVITVEDPVEKRIEGVNQVQINAKAGMTFPAALRSILRSDPDVVLLGEIRDSETATIAVEASLTGHLVLSTLHTNGAPEAMTRLVEMGVEPYLVGTSVSCVMAQRLARRLCEKCKTLKVMETPYLESMGYPNTEPQEFYAPVGCTNCSGTGYRGRVAVIEVLKITEEIERMTVESQPASVIRRHAEADGFVSLRKDGFRRVEQGLTTFEEVLRVTA